MARETGCPTQHLSCLCISSQGGFDSAIPSNTMPGFFCTVLGSSLLMFLLLLVLLLCCVHLLVFCQQLPQVCLCLFNSALHTPLAHICCCTTPARHCCCNDMCCTRSLIWEPPVITLACCRCLFHCHMQQCLTYPAHICRVCK